MEQINNENPHKINRLNANMGLIKKLKKTRFYKVLTLTIATVSLAAVMLYTTGCASIDLEMIDNTNIEQIVQYYEDDETVKEVLDYIELSKRINDLSLDKYIIDEELYSSLNISNELMSVEELTKLVNNFSDSYEGSYKNINSQYEHIETILNLRRQEKLVNTYIYNTGYAVAHEKISTATKGYAREVFGAENYDDINLWRPTSSEPSDRTIVFKYNGGNCSISVGISDGWGHTAEENNICEGIDHMINTDTKYDKNFEDNHLYNSQRNQFIKNALQKSVELSEAVENKDLYISELAGKLMR